ncbi:uncharacterized protein LOC113953336 [Corapipo altera]|uniref:uncharacterized protein LOC113953336 n=1 Tax=Corapipo altera TaxID=415028 RepID=UPI000FD68A71|nr:uncharacterized protein LOC113953336 [Corapipo altera]
MLGPRAGRSAADQRGPGLPRQPPPPRPSRPPLSCDGGGRRGSRPGPAPPPPSPRHRRVAATAELCYPPRQRPGPASRPPPCAVFPPQRAPQRGLAAPRPLKRLPRGLLGVAGAVGSGGTRGCGAAVGDPLGSCFGVCRSQKMPAGTRLAFWGRAGGAKVSVGYLKSSVKIFSELPTMGVRISAASKVCKERKLWEERVSQQENIGFFIFLLEAGMGQSTVEEAESGTLTS